MSETNSIEIEIGNQNYFIRGTETEEHLREVAHLVRRKIESIRKNDPKASLQMATTLAAFDLASELIQRSRKSQDYRSTILSKASQLLDRVQLELSTKPPA